MNLISWSPLRELDSLFDRYAREMRSDGNSLLTGPGEWKPATTISETDKEFIIKADLPEVDRKDIDVSVENGILSIRGERRVEKEVEGEKEHRREVAYGSFSRSFSLPENVDDSKIAAESKNGVLILRLPKTDAVKPEARKITVD
jgi:HSP20 family protein